MKSQTVTLKQVSVEFTAAIMSSKMMDVSDLLRMRRRTKLKNESDSLKIKRKSSTEKDIGSLRPKPDFWTNPKAAIKRAYIETDDEILENVVGPRGGSTAVTAILVNGEKLIVANVGDSRAILCRNGAAKQISVDHEPQKEKKLVESRGGFVSQRPGNVPRVDAQLVMTRACGDEKLKEHITAEPDILIETIDADTEFIILASDDLWEVISNQEAADCIRDLSNAQEASEELIKEARSRKSLDDISCIVVMFL